MLHHSFCSSCLVVRPPDSRGNDIWLPGPEDGAFIRQPGRLWRPSLPADEKDEDKGRRHTIGGESPPLQHTCDKSAGGLEDAVEQHSQRRSFRMSRPPPPSMQQASSATFNFGSPALGQTTAWKRYSTPAQELLLKSDLSAEARAKLDYATPVEDQLRSLLKRSEDEGNPVQAQQSPSHAPNRNQTQEQLTESPQNSTSSPLPLPPPPPGSGLTSNSGCAEGVGLPSHASQNQDAGEQNGEQASSCPAASEEPDAPETRQSLATPSSTSFKAQLTSAGDQIRNLFQTFPAPSLGPSSKSTPASPGEQQKGARYPSSPPPQNTDRSHPTSADEESDSLSHDWLAVQKARIQNLLDRAGAMTGSNLARTSATQDRGKSVPSASVPSASPTISAHPESTTEARANADELVASLALGPAPAPSATPAPVPAAAEPVSSPPVPHLTPPLPAVVRRVSDDELPASALAARAAEVEEQHQTSTSPRLSAESYPPELLRQQTDWQPPRLPVVFVHGLFGFSELKVSNLSISYWRGAPEALEANGCEVLICHLPTAASIQERAAALKAEVEERFAGREVNLIAHSMGGLDCRYLISRLSHGRARFTFKVASLTTITTPHRGSSFADYMLEKVVGVSRVPKLVSALTALGVPGGGRAFEDLTTERIAIFNLTCPDRPDVRYYSWGAEFTPSLFSEFRFPHGIILANEGPNDGLVSVASSKWGQYQGTLKDVSHLGIIGWNNSAATPNKSSNTSSPTSWFPSWTVPTWSPFKKGQQQQKAHAVDQKPKGLKDVPSSHSFAPFPSRSSSPSIADTTTGTKSATAAANSAAAAAAKASSAAAAETAAAADSSASKDPSFTIQPTSTSEASTSQAATPSPKPDRRFDAAAFYLQICEDLAKDGF